jgi:DNA-binding beta-propeller fold protein YncE
MIPLPTKGVALSVGEPADGKAVWVLPGAWGVWRFFWGVRPGKVVQIDARTCLVLAVISTKGNGVAVGYDSIWTTAGDRSEYKLERVDPASGRVLASFRRLGGSVAFGEGSVWVGDPYDHFVSRLDPQTNQSLAIIVVDGWSSSIIVGGGSVWVKHPGRNSISRIDPATNTRTATIRLGPQQWGALGLVYGVGAVWAGAGYEVARIDPKTCRVVRRVPIGAEPSSLAVAGGCVWASAFNGTVTRINPDTNQMVDQFVLATKPITAVAVSAGALWFLAGDTLYRIDLQGTGAGGNRIPQETSITALFCDQHGNL